MPDISSLSSVRPCLVRHPSRDARPHDRPVRARTGWAPYTRRGARPPGAHTFARVSQVGSHDRFSSGQVNRSAPLAAGVVLAVYSPDWSPPNGQGYFDSQGLRARTTFEVHEEAAPGDEGAAFRVAGDQTVPCCPGRGGGDVHPSAHEPQDHPGPARALLDPCNWDRYAHLLQAVKERDLAASTTWQSLRRGRPRNLCDPRRVGFIVGHGCLSIESCSDPDRIAAGQGPFRARGRYWDRIAFHPLRRHASD
jgi:hypothetical protein